jgi:putative FmdB family regulatory protein
MRRGGNLFFSEETQLPIFEYRCKDCGKLFEVLFKSRDEKLKVTCPACKSAKSEKVFSVFSGKVEKPSIHAGPCSCCSNKGPVCPGMS